MTGRVFIRKCLINVEAGQVFFLTLIAFLTLLSRLTLADVLPPEQAVQNDADKLRAAEATNYVRKQVMGQVSILPNSVRNLAGWFSGSWHSMNIMSPFGDDEPAPAASSTEHSFADPEPHTPDQSLILSSNFHHKGFLPTHDAMMIGPTFASNLVDNKLQLTSHSFIGQSWHSMNNYWGSEVSLAIAKHPDGLPWGQISFGYVGGSDYLTDHGSGIDMHGDVDLTHGFKFTSGMRQDNAFGENNYMMVKWKMDLQ